MKNQNIKVKKINNYSNTIKWLRKKELSVKKTEQLTLNYKLPTHTVMDEIAEEELKELIRQHGPSDILNIIKKHL